jgi:RNA polymerase sigma factor (sigma-70 family)
MTTATVDRKPTQNLRSHDRIALDRAATELVTNYGPLLMREARSHCASQQDAEDAYQRSLEKLLLKAPATDSATLIPWLRVVVRNEALEIARSRPNEMIGIAPTTLEALSSELPTPEEFALSAADAEIGFEALERMNADQISCLLAQAAGLNYDEIAERLGFTRRKVTRCLQKGRETYCRAIVNISEGAECEKMRSLFERVLNADTDAALELRPHLRHCRACRSQLIAYREAPQRVAALMPPSLLVISTQHVGLIGKLTAAWEALVARTLPHLLGADRWAEVTTAKKAVAIVAVTTTVAAGATVAPVVKERSPERKSVAAPAVSGGGVIVSGRELVDKRAEPVAGKPRKKKRRKQKTPSATAPPAAPPVQYTSEPKQRSSASEQIVDGSQEFTPEGR